MKLISKFALAGLLVAFLAVPAISQQHQSGGTMRPSETYKEPQAKRSEEKAGNGQICTGKGCLRYGEEVGDGHEHSFPSTAPKVEQPKTQTGSQALPPSGVKGESQGLRR
jgi:hypothetical protein